MSQVPQSSFLLLEDKRIFGLNKVHKNVLKRAEENYSNVKVKKKVLKFVDKIFFVIKKIFHSIKSRVYQDLESKSETDDIILNGKIFDFVTDGLKFDPQVIKSKAKHALSYNAGEVKEIFEDKRSLGNGEYVEPMKYKFKYLNLTPIFAKNPIKENDKSVNNELVLFDQNEKTFLESVPIANIKFKSKNYFEQLKNSSSDTELNRDNIKLESKSEGPASKSLNNSTDDLRQGIFLTETSFHETKLKSSRSRKSERSLSNKKSISLKNKNNKREDLKVLENVDWDEYLIDLLSEDAARWIVMKKISDCKSFSSLV
jgi:hypothetical protein